MFCNNRKSSALRLGLVALVFLAGHFFLTSNWKTPLTLSGLAAGFIPTPNGQNGHGGGGKAKPRLNTTWHHQIALEEPTGLTAVQTPYGPLNRTRVALLMENRPLPYLIPLMLHFMAVVPPEWSFRFMGSAESLAMMRANPIVRRYVEGKKLFLDPIPYEIVQNIESYGTVSHLLTRPWFYEEWLWPADSLFLFQDDSMICSASKKTVNDFVDEEWSFLGGSNFGHDIPHPLGGGFSLRRVPHLIKLLRNHSFEDFVASGKLPSEDYYFSTALWDQPWAKKPIAEDAIQWGVIADWHDDPNEMPLGFHPYSSDGMFRGPDGQKNQDKAYKYCPELAIVSVGRWDCKCEPNGARPGGLGG